MMEIQATLFSSLMNEKWQVHFPGIARDLMKRKNSDN